MSKILIVYHYYGQHPPRATKWDHLFCFQKHGGHHCYYLNLAFHQAAPWLWLVHFDLVIFHTLFFSLRWKRDAFTRYVQKALPLKRIAAVKVAIPQDEFINTDLVSAFITDFSIRHVFSAAPESEWPKIYAGVDFEQVSFYNVLTGYLDDATVTKIHALATNSTKRTIDIGYRTGRSDPTLGAHGYLKGEIGEVFQARQPADLVLDISNRPEDVFLGDEWYKFLLRCKYTLGAESGSSLLDRDGTLRQQILAYAAAHPHASFSEIQAACFPNADNALGLSVVGPRHLEACATQTCQVLIEGYYNGMLVPNKHYIAVKRDYSNLEQVLQIIRQDDLRTGIVERAYADVVASGRYSYRSFVDFVLRHSLPEQNCVSINGKLLVQEQAIYRWMQWQDQVVWLILAWLSAVNRWLLWLLPLRILRRIKAQLVKWFLA